MAKKVYRAGLIPFYRDQDGNIQMMFMRPSEPKYGGPQFQIAKGKVEDGEDTETAALREANEELGLFKGNIKNLRKVGEFMGRTTVFIALIDDPNMFGDSTDETEEVKWMTPEEFYEQGRTLHIPVVKSCVRHIKKMLDL